MEDRIVLKLIELEEKLDKCATKEDLNEKFDILYRMMDQTMKSLETLRKLYQSSLK